MYVYKYTYIHAPAYIYVRIRIYTPNIRSMTFGTGNDDKGRCAKISERKGESQIERYIYIEEEIERKKDRTRERLTTVPVHFVMWTISSAQR